MEARASAIPRDSGMKYSFISFIMSKWHFTGSAIKEDSEASSSSLNRVGTGPEMSSPSNREASRGQARRMKQGRLSLQMQLESVITVYLYEQWQNYLACIGFAIQTLVW